MQYPATTLSLQKGKYYVVVTVPAALRDQFNGQKQLKRSTGTSDKQLAGQRQHEKAVKLYAKMDQANQTNSPIYNVLVKYIESIGYSSNSILNGKDLSNPYVVDDILFAFNRDKYIAMYSGNDDKMYDAQRRIEPAFSDVDTLNEARRLEILKRLEKSFSDAANSYASQKEWGREKTRISASKAFEVFTETMGDLALTQITKKTGYDYAKILSGTLANKTIRNRIGYIKQVLKFCEKEGWIDTNPFIELDLSGYGARSESYRSFTTDQMNKLFKQPLPADVDLLLSILVTTGMRLDEAATLNFEDIKTENSISYFDITTDGKVIKNIGSARKVPLIPVIKKKIGSGSGRLFPRFRIDADGKAQGPASKACMPYIRKVTDDKKIVVHSLRGTLKDLLRDADVSKEVNDFMTGHGSGDVAGSYGSGPALKVRYKALNSVDHPWLKESGQ